jgi:hypothetical protein
MDWNNLQELAMSEIESILKSLPRPLREKAQCLPIVFKKRPNKELQADGIELDTLGLFTGVDLLGDGGEVLPSQIILFPENI